MDRRTHATLENWYVHHGNRIMGEICCDHKERFTDGELVITSKLRTDVNILAEGTIISTQNTVYTLGKPGKKW